MSRWTNWLGPLDCTDNLKALKEAYEIGVMEMPAEVYKETGYQLNQFLDALIPGLIQALIALAASTALGGAIGAVVGAFFGGAGAIPGAVGGAAVGFDLGLAVLGWLGLGFLAYSIGHSLGELTALLELAVRRARDAPNSPQPRVQIRLAGRDFARSGAILIRLVLQGIAMWLTQKGVNKIGELVAELRKSKLGPRFAAWVEENAAALMRDPRLKPHRGQGSAAKEVVSEAQSPSRLANRRPEPVQESPPPKPKAQETGAKFGKSESSDYRSTFFEANPDLQGQVVVHHAVEQQVLKRYPGVVSEAEMHSLENLRGVPNEINSDVHLSQIRRAWNQFYRETPNPSKEQLLQKASEIDKLFGSQFKPPVGH